MRVWTAPRSGGSGGARVLPARGSSACAAPHGRQGALSEHRAGEPGPGRFRFRFRPVPGVYWRPRNMVCEVLGRGAGSGIRLSRRSLAHSFCLAFSPSFCAI